MASFCNYVVVASLFAHATGFVASGPAVPNVLAIGRARVGVAILIRFGCTTDFAAVERGSDYRFRATLNTTSTALSAGREGGPFREHAVDRASKCIARLRFRQTGASNATVSDISDDGTRLGLGAGATRLGARSVRRPIGNHTITGTRESVAGS